MIGYALVGTNDLPRAAAFYDALLPLLGAKRFMESERSVSWAVDPTKCAFGVIKPYDGKPATIGNGSMIALVAESRATVDAIHAKALALGGKDEGAAGLRGEGYYAGYFRDLDGNKLNVFCLG